MMAELLTLIALAVISMASGEQTMSAIFSTGGLIVSVILQRTKKDGGK